MLEYSKLNFSFYQDVWDRADLILGIRTFKFGSLTTFNQNRDSLNKPGWRFEELDEAVFNLDLAFRLPTGHVLEAIPGLLNGSMSWDSPSHLGNILQVVLGPQNKPGP